MESLIKAFAPVTGYEEDELEQLDLIEELLENKNSCTLDVSCRRMKMR